MIRRTVEIVKDEKFDDVVGKTMWEVDKAIGYLCRWSIGADPRHVKLRLCLEENGNIGALYLGENGQMTYEMGAIWHPESGTYSFHS